MCHFYAIVIKFMFFCFDFSFQCSLEFVGTWCCRPISCDIQRSTHWTQWPTKWKTLISICCRKNNISRLWRVSIFNPCFKSVYNERFQLVSANKSYMVKCRFPNYIFALCWGLIFDWMIFNLAFCFSVHLTRSLPLLQPRPPPQG